MIRGRGGLRRIASPLQRAVIVHKRLNFFTKPEACIATTLSRAFLVNYLDAVTHLADAKLLQLRVAQ